MSSRTKYGKNRNHWRRVYGLRRRKPIVFIYLDADTGEQIVIDLNRTIRGRDFFEGKKAVPGVDV